MKRLLGLAGLIVTLLSTSLGHAAEATVLTKMHGGNVLQALDSAVRNDEAKASFSDATIKIINNVTTMTVMPLENTITSLSLYPGNGKVKTIMFGIHWKKDAVDALQAVVSINSVANILGRFIRPDISKDDLAKVRKALVGESMDALDGKERKIRIDGTIVVSQFVDGVGFLFSIGNINEK